MALILGLNSDIARWACKPLVSGKVYKKCVNINNWILITRNK